MWEYFQAGGPLMWPLLLCSIIAVALVLERCWFWHTLHFKNDEAECAKLLNEARETGTVKNVKPVGLLSAMIHTGALTPAEERDKAMEVVALEGIARMRRGMSLLDTIITASPMLGIMGTVLGIIASFDMLGAAGVSEPKAVIAGIAQALITTASGLGIAVFAIFPFNYFNFRIENYQDMLEVYATRLQLAMEQRDKIKEG